MITGPSILIVEDELNLGTTLSEYLRSKGHACYHAQDATKAREYFMRYIPRIVLMDIELPDGNGLSLAEEMRGQRKDFVLLFLSAQNDPETKVKGLELGAEDYITKPFALKELMLRLNRIFKNDLSLSTLPPEINLGKLKIFFKRFEIHTSTGEILPLKQKESGILELLYRHLGHAVTRDEIIKVVWGENAFPSNRTVDNYIVKLRRWCETDKESGVEISSIRGVGYKLTLNNNK